jgi:hypothetical protein
MTEIRIYRKAKMTGRPTKKSAETVHHALALSRVERPYVVEFFLSGDFHRLPIVPQQVIKNAPLRQRDHLNDGWIVPESDYGRGHRGPEKVGQTLLLWIVRYFCDTGVINRDEFAIVVDGHNADDNYIQGLMDKARKR